MKFNLSKKRDSSTMEVKVGGHIIPQVTQFKYEGEIEEYANHRIQS